MKDKSGNDSVLNINDSIDLRNPLKIKVTLEDAGHGEAVALALVLPLVRDAV